MKLDTPATSKDLWSSLSLLAACFGLILLFQFQTGAFSSDMGGDPDEAAHAVTSLMVRDYLVDGLGQNPLAFAQRYYEAFPKVAFGHYPPLYYFIAAAGLLPFPSPQTFIVLQALCAAFLAVMTFRLGRQFMSPWLAATAAIITIFLPLTLKLTQHIMSDILLAALCLWAAEIWQRYLIKPTLARALAFGVVAAAAILTKGSGMLLCLLPPAATLLAGRWRLMFKLSWWCSALPVAILAGPWMLYSTKISKEGMTRMTPLEYLVEATPYYLKSLPGVLGWALLLLVLVGTALIIGRGWQQKGLPPVQASLAALAIGAIAVLLLIPVGLTTRYLLPVIPVLLLAGAYGVQSLLNTLKLPQTQALGTAALLASFALAAGWPQKDVHGFSTAVQLASVPQPGQPAVNWLVSSDPRGEGAVVGDACFECATRSPSNLRVYRATKELGATDWMGRDYKAAFTTEAEILAHLQKKNITRVFVDLSSPLKTRFPHENLLLSALKSSPQTWRLIKEQPVSRTPHERGTLLLYGSVAQ